MQNNDLIKYDVQDVESFSIAAPEGKRFFTCIGGSKNFQMFLADKNLSRSEFMKCYENEIDESLRPVYEDGDIIITQDASIAMPGLYIVATKKKYRTFNEMPLELYSKCLQYVFKIGNFIKKNGYVDDFYSYYEEHLYKPASTHFWLLPIHNILRDRYRLNITIFSFDVWEYQKKFKFKEYKKTILELNEKVKKYLGEKYELQ